MDPETNLRGGDVLFPSDVVPDEGGEGVDEGDQPINFNDLVFLSRQRLMLNSFHLQHIENNATPTPSTQVQVPDKTVCAKKLHFTTSLKITFCQKTHISSVN